MGKYISTDRVSTYWHIWYIFREKTMITNCHKLSQIEMIFYSGNLQPKTNNNNFISISCYLNPTGLRMLGVGRKGIQGWFHDIAEFTFLCMGPEIKTTPKHTFYPLGSIFNQTCRTLIFKIVPDFETVGTFSCVWCVKTLPFFEKLRISIPSLSAESD